MVSMPSDLTEALATDLDRHFERLVEAFQDRLFGFALRLVGNASDAEEIAQDAFVRAYRALARYPSEQVRTLSLRAWLFQITLNVARNRQRNRRPDSLPLDGSGDDDTFDLSDAREPRGGSGASRDQRRACSPAQRPASAVPDRGDSAARSGMRLCRNRGDPRSAGRNGEGKRSSRNDASSRGFDRRGGSGVSDEGKNPDRGPMRPVVDGYASRLGEGEA
jgi:RNA polymerase sigma factor (sigma-70 family)